MKHTRFPSIISVSMTIVNWFSKMQSMPTHSFDEAQSNLQQLINEVAESHKPIVITGERSNAVLIDAEDWSSIQETLYLLSVPGMGESIKEAMAIPLEECDEKIEW